MAQPYSVLAAGYDAVMAHVDYPHWAGYVQGLIARHLPGAASVIELGGGTGAFAAALQPRGGYAYRMFDGAEAMVEAARARFKTANRPVEAAVLAFEDAVPGPPADVVVLLYDGLNYLLTLDAVERLLASVRDALAPGGIAIVDQSTPANSENHTDGFDDAGETAAFDYLRTSRYDPATRLHTTSFAFTMRDGTVEAETHVQRAYTMGEVAGRIAAAGLAVVAAYDEFSADPAGDQTERIHWVLRRATDPGRAA